MALLIVCVVVNPLLSVAVMINLPLSIEFIVPLFEVIDLSPHITL